MESNPADPKSINFFAYLNQGGSGADCRRSSRTRSNDGQRQRAAGITKFGSKFTDARFLVNAAGGDYVRENVKQTGDPFVTGDPDTTTLFNFPKKSTDCRNQVDGGRGR